MNNDHANVDAFKGSSNFFQDLLTPVKTRVKLFLTLLDIEMIRLLRLFKTCSD